MGAPPEASDESVSLLALASLQGVGYKTLSNIAKSGRHFQDILTASSLRALRSLLSDADIRNASDLAERICSDTLGLFQQGRAALNNLEHRGVKLIHRFEDRFPAQLRSFKDAPTWLFVQGDHTVLQRPMVTIVGSRKATDMGLFLARCACYLLHGTDICTVSGLAEGIDREVHTASVETGVPTVAVLGTGIDNQYPASATDVRQSILRSGGCIVTEYLPSEPPVKSSFVWRNRIQAGLSKVTIPVEWQIRSGTAHTVNFALDGRRAVIGVRPPFGSDSEENRFLRERGMPVFTLPNEADDFREDLFRLME